MRRNDWAELGSKMFAVYLASTSVSRLTSGVRAVSNHSSATAIGFYFFLFVLEGSAATLLWAKSNLFASATFGKVETTDDEVGAESTITVWNVRRAVAVGSTIGGILLLVRGLYFVIQGGAESVLSISSTPRGYGWVFDHSGTFEGIGVVLVGALLVLFRERVGATVSSKISIDDWEGPMPSKQTWSHIGLMLFAVLMLLNAIGLTVALVTGYNHALLTSVFSQLDKPDLIGDALFIVATLVLWFGSRRLASVELERDEQKEAVRIIATAAMAFAGVWVAATSVRDLVSYSTRYFGERPSRLFRFTGSPHDSVFLYGSIARLVVAAALYFGSRRIGEWIATRESKSAPSDEALLESNQP
ncbi:MAG: hypothetical protein ACYDCC_10285 [Actinomycetota bacterium]